MNQSQLKVHAIILALNEEVFIKAQLDTIYAFCDRISIITQYDRDWYGKTVIPDQTVPIILNYPDPGGKIHLVIRKLPDEAAARNMEMLSFTLKSCRGIMSHGNPISDIQDFHRPPDYFWIIDADEIYDPVSLPSILEYLTQKRPRGLRITGYNYIRSWNRRVPRSVIDFTHFGFLKPGVLFEMRRTVSWNEQRLAKLLRILKLPDWSSRFFGFETCPEERGVFHHGCWLGNNQRISAKFIKSSHKESQEWEASSIDQIPFEFLPFEKLPLNIRTSIWPLGYIESIDENT